MELISSPKKRLRGTVKVPGDKSITHRAILFGACAKGVSKVSNFLDGDDCMATLEAVKSLSVTAKVDGSDLFIEGKGHNQFAKPDRALDALNSGTTIRLLAGVLAGQNFESTIDGDSYLRKRPMGRVVEPLKEMGAKINSNLGYPPLLFQKSSLRGINYKMKIASAQVQTCLILASLRASSKSTITMPALGRDHTTRMLKKMGAKIKTSGLLVEVLPGELEPTDVVVPGDFSSAIFWVVAALVHPDAELKISGVGINPTRIAALNVLKNMGGDISLENETNVGGEPSADLVVRSSKLKATRVEGKNLVPFLIDEVPILAVACAMAEGVSVFEDVHELRVKESDRIKSTSEWLEKAGVRCEDWDSGFKVYGTGAIKGGEFDCFGDHRIALSQAVAGTFATSTVKVVDASPIKTSYPTFFDTLLELEE